MTAQIPENLIFKGRNVRMTCTPLKSYLEERSIKFPFFTTACWRGYVGYWEIKDNKLYLLSLSTFSDNAVSLSTVFSDYKDEPYHLKKFSGEITFIEGECLEYFHGGFGGIYEYETHLCFKDGHLISGYKTNYIKNKQRVNIESEALDFEDSDCNREKSFTSKNFKLVLDRLISPPRCEWDLLRQPLEAGERKFLEYLDENLGEGWEVYIQPAFNGLCPDIIILHPNKGVCIFEIKNWDFKAIEYRSYREANGRMHLKGVSKTGEIFKIKNNPVDQLLLYRKEMRHLYCPQLDTPIGGSILYCGLVFPSASDEELKDVILPIFECRNRILFSKNNRTAKYLIFSKDNFEKNFLDSFPRVITNSFNNSSMDPKIAEYLRYWLIEPDASKEQRTPLILDKKQLEFATTRPEKSKYRRLRGPAGSGKSLVVAKKAAYLLHQNKSVLVCTFNITLINYLSDLTVREYSRARKDATWLNFHNLAARICINAGFEYEYNEIYKNASENFVDNNELCNLVEEALNCENYHKYDAILVDEGQDYDPRWWNILRRLLQKDGEMLLVADTTQDIYGQGKLWTDQAMKNAGFVGLWASLESTYRLPISFIPMIQDFAVTYIPQVNIILPHPLDIGDNDLFKEDVNNAGNFIFKWIQATEFVENFSKFNDILGDCIDKFQEDMRSLGLSFADQTYLVTKHKYGADLCRLLKSKRISFTDIFSTDLKEVRRKKQYFFKGSQSAKVCTIHSYKGWESKALFLIIDKFNKNNNDAELVYTALTRLKGGEKSLIYIVCFDRELAEFGCKWNAYYNS